jgi:hypothetical protein
MVEWERRMPYLKGEEYLKDVNRLRNVLKAYIFLLAEVQRAQIALKETNGIKVLKKTVSAIK